MKHTDEAQIDVSSFVFVRDNGGAKTNGMPGHRLAQTNTPMRKSWFDNGSEVDVDGWQVMTCSLTYAIRWVSL